MPLRRVSYRAVRAGWRWGRVLAASLAPMIAPGMALADGGLAVDDALRLCKTMRTDPGTLVAELALAGWAEVTEVDAATRSLLAFGMLPNTEASLLRPDSSDAEWLAVWGAATAMASRATQDLGAAGPDWPSELLGDPETGSLLHVQRQDAPPTADVGCTLVIPEAALGGMARPEIATNAGPTPVLIEVERPTSRLLRAVGVTLVMSLDAAAFRTRLGLTEAAGAVLWSNLQYEPHMFAE